MNIKKLFAILAGVSMVANVALPGLAQAATPDNEYGRAYTWAYSQGVTTKDTYEAANMWNEITRAEFAKMASQWAMKLLWKKVNEDATCVFSDIDSVQGDLHDFVLTSCKLGLMGQLSNGNTEFRPHALITRGEIGTVLSRALWNSTYEGATPYFADHLKALQKAGIMKKIDNPYDNAKRGDVMLMLHRTSEWEAINEANELLACLAKCEADDTECVMACSGAEDNGEEEDTVVKSGDLAVTSTPASERKAIIGAVSDLDTLKFKTSEEVTISKIVLERYGYSKADDVVKVWLEDEDGNEITSKKGVNSRDEVELSFKKDYKVVDGSINATIVVQLAGAVTTWGTIWFKLVSAESTAENQELDLDEYVPYTYDMVGYDAVSVTIEAKWNEKDYNYEEGELYEVAKVKLKTTTSPLLVNGIVITNERTGGTKLEIKDFLDKVEVQVNGEKVDGAKFTINNKNELNVTFDEVEVPAKSNATFAISIALAGFDQYGQGVQFIVKNPTDIKMTEKKTWARVSINTLPAKADYPVHKFVGSKIKLSNTKLWNIEYAKGSSDVVVAEGTMDLSESVELYDGTYVVTATYSTWADIIEEMKLVIGWIEYDVDKTYVANATTATFTFNDITIEKGGKFQIKVDIDRDAPEGTTVTFSPAFDDAAFASATYPDADDSPVLSDEISGVINFASKLTVQASKASLSKTLKEEDKEFKDNDTDENVVFEWVYTAKKGSVSLTDFEVEAVDSALTLWASGTINFYLYLDNSKNYAADVRLKGAAPLAGSDSFSSVKVDAEESVNVKVVAEVTAKNLGAKDLGKFKITLRGEDEDGNPAGEASKNTNFMKVVTKGTIILGEANTSKENTVLRRGSDGVLADFTVEPDGSSKADLEQLVFTVSGIALTKIDDVDVEINNKTIRDDNCTLTTGATSTITCKDFAETITSAGANVKVSLTEADSATWKVELTLTTINDDATVNKVFKKSFVDVLVTFTKQDFGKVSTEFTIDVDKYKSTYTVSDLKLYTYSASGCDAQVGNTEASVTKGKSFTVTNWPKNQEICKVVYTIATADDTVITKDEYPDYFKKISTVGSDRAEDLLVYNDGSN